jgi:hypothetical protein
MGKIEFLDTDEILARPPPAPTALPAIRRQPCLAVAQVRRSNAVAPPSSSAPKVMPERTTSDSLNPHLQHSARIGYDEEKETDECPSG